MVPADSASCPQSRTEDCIEIRADHSKITKYTSISDEHYQRVWQKIKQITENYQGRHWDLCPNIARGTTKTHFIVPYPKNDSYIGRSLVYDFIEKKLRGRVHGRTPVYLIVGLCGLAGSG
jgi:hypothetical protein